MSTSALLSSPNGAQHRTAVGGASPARPAGIQAIALVEGAKGALVLLAGVRLLSLSQQDVQAIAEQIVRLRHLDPAGKSARVLLEAGAQVTDTHLWLLAAAAFFYSTVRAVEAYGLWKARSWAEWFALGSTCLYLPIEIYQLGHRVTWIRVGVFAVNIVVVAYMAYIVRRRRERKRELISGGPVAEPQPTGYVECI